MSRRLAVVLAASLAFPAFGLSPADAASKARAFRKAHEAAILEEFTSFLAIPNLASDRTNIERNAAAIVEMFTKRGAAARILRVPEAPPLVVVNLPAPGAKTTIAFYAHYDGQPLDPAQWTTPPWQPVIRGDRIYARSASDDKAPIIAMAAALDVLRDAGAKPGVNLKLVFEGEEEAGSPHLGEYFERFPDDLAADAYMICDGPVHQSRRMQLFYGARGVTDVELTVYGPARALHSGHYGNWAPNPIVTLTHLIDSMRDEDGRILIKGFYDDVTPLTVAERAALAAIPPIEPELKRELALGRTEGSGKALNELILAPALNLRGISGGNVGEKAANAISTQASASIDFRLVPAQTPEGVRRRFEQHLIDQGFFIVRETPDATVRASHPKVIRVNWGAGYPAARTPMDHPLSRRIAAIIGAAKSTPPIELPTLGGSVPMYLFQRGGTLAIGVPIANHDNNQHAANENLRLENLWDGIELFAALFSNL
jgi:acetylornithine deacetylase/succinyl-diaminopimelate desuccinylase-like protein